MSERRCVAIVRADDGTELTVMERSPLTTANAWTLLRPGDDFDFGGVRYTFVSREPS